MDNKGFSFLGLLLLVVLMASTASVVVVTMTSTFANRGMNETVKKMDRLISAIERYKADSATNANPPTLAHLYTDVGAVGCAPNTATSKLDGWCGPYLDDVFQENPNADLKDGWGTTFEYDNTGNIYSWGPNRTDNAGGGDDLTRTF